ncbi:MAG: hypothetical protein KDH96_03150 [Candidatus Riesia sp.]|nr:hypothetical protein [Candidatus Riesia sp.]
MSKKGIMFVTNTCGYCKAAKGMIEKEYKDLTVKEFEYVNVQQQMTDEMNGLVQMLVNSGHLRGVPVTIMIEDEGEKKSISKLVRGFDKNGIKSIIDEVIEPQKSGEQLEIKFEE